jgi:hypothetical protein
MCTVVALPFNDPLLCLHVMQQAPTQAEKGSTLVGLSFEL